MIRWVTLTTLRIAALWGCLAGVASGLELSLPAEPLSESELDRQRGGFVVNNLEISIGLEQVVSANGETLVVNRLYIPNLNQVMNGQRLPAQVEHVITELGNSADTALITGRFSAGSWATVIQNSLNGTVIQNMQQLNIEINNLGGVHRLPRGITDSLLLPP